jgi:hypothetical protein
LDSREPPRVLRGSGAWLEVDGRLGNVPRENVCGNGDSPRHDFGKLIRLLVVPARHVVKLYAIERILEGTHSFAIRLHIVIVTARVFHDLVDHELRVPPHVEALHACLNGDFKAAKEGLVFSHVV